MNWNKVVEKLDCEWVRHRQEAEMATDTGYAEQMLLLSQIALMLADGLRAGLKP